MSLSERQETNNWATLVTRLIWNVINGWYIFQVTADTVCVDSFCPKFGTYSKLEVTRSCWLKYVLCDCSNVRHHFHYSSSDSMFKLVWFKLCHTSRHSRQKISPCYEQFIKGNNPVRQNYIWTRSYLSTLSMQSWHLLNRLHRLRQRR